MLLTLFYPIFELACKLYFLKQKLLFCGFVLHSLGNSRVAYMGMYTFSQECKLVLL